MSRTNRRPTPPDPTPVAPNYRRIATLAVGAALTLSIGAYAMSTSAASVSTTVPSVNLAGTGVATAGNIVVEGSEIAMGMVPLDETVTPSWRLTNEGVHTVVLGEPHASVNEGCCPGPLTLDRTALAPGETAILTFPLQMHAGMDGPHDFDVHVPLADDPDTFLTLGVTGDFG